eukprot:NODE_2814_length_1084_cov_30.306165_g2684_i0.p1 GENE.NODE_2814_length_1084_cov_30.306165_g2684_i0~~NODE_2814_length_1084_cov_30.306165_g2684_i0.p1  ORF type:complete len:334 (-),score=63.05 NODE_2814_length_1084_cov_30.306165_g2684_i0:24-1025(-)
MSEDECPELVPTKVPLSILTGFLGSGKTTLLNRILTQNHHRRIAVIMNEFSVGGGQIEKELTIATQGKAVEDWVEMPNGCLCCSAKGRAVQVIETLLATRSNIDHILLETSGLADPGPILADFWVDEALESPVVLDGVITVVDAKNIRSYLHGSQANEEGGGYHEASQQIAHADKLLLNKIDLVAPEAVPALKALLASVNPLAEIECTAFGAMDNVSALLTIHSLRMDRVPGQVPSTLLSKPHACGDCSEDYTQRLDERAFVGQAHGRVLCASDESPHSYCGRAILCAAVCGRNVGHQARQHHHRHQHVGVYWTQPSPQRFEGCVWSVLQLRH